MTKNVNHTRFQKSKRRVDKINVERDQLYNTIKTRNRANQLEEIKAKHADEDQNKNWKTAILDHAIKNNHQFDFENMTPSHYEENHRKRKNLESLYIYAKHNDACNFKQDTMYLNVTSKQVINSYNYHLKKKDN